MSTHKYFCSSKLIECYNQFQYINFNITEILPYRGEVIFWIFQSSGMPIAGFWIAVWHRNWLNGDRAISRLRIFAWFEFASGFLVAKPTHWSRDKLLFLFCRIICIFLVYFREAIMEWKRRSKSYLIFHIIVKIFSISFICE